MDNRIYSNVFIAYAEVCVQQMNAQLVKANTNDGFDATRLARILLPKRGEPRNVRSLYFVENEATTPGRVNAVSRTEAILPAGSETSFETYFNAFPASYWRRWSQLDEVKLRIEITGEARVDLYRSKYDGSRIGIEGAQIETDENGHGVAEFTVSLAPFEDGGWIWFDLTCEKETRLHSAGWYATVEAGEQTFEDETLPAAEPSVTIGIPTFNRPTDAVAALHALASDPEVDGRIEAIIMPDQGDKHPADEPDFDEVAEHFGDRLCIVQQGNLGGS